MSVVTVLLPRMLVPLAAGASRVTVSVGVDASLGDVIASLSTSHPAIARRLVDETGQLRRHVNVYVDGEDCRRLAGLATAVGDGTQVQVIGSIAGG
jgi:molybdopterin converting factor small subunit